MIRLLICLLLFSIVRAEMRGFLTQDEIDLFYKQGYLLKRSCLAAEEMNNLHAITTVAIDNAFEAIRNRENPTTKTTDQTLYVKGSRVVFQDRPDRSVSIARINGIGGIEPRFLATLRSDKMVHTFFELLGTSELEHIICQLHPKMPGDGIAYPKHRDIQFRKQFDPEWRDILENGSYAICIIPVESMTRENGGLWIDRNNYPEPQGLPEDLIWIEAEPGDLLFMHPYLFHGSGPNLSPTASRKTVLTGFCAFGANHKAYPGAEVNIHLTLSEEGTIQSEVSPWIQTSSGLEGNH